MTEGAADIQVRLGDGIRVETRSLGTVAFDPGRADADINAVSHAHTDHLPRTKPADPVIASPLTARLAAERRGWDGLAVTDHPAIDLHPAGHVEGSRATLVHDEDVRILYTGDVSTRNRPGIDGFDPVPADVLILEATYGTQQYQFPPIDSVVGDIKAWLDDLPEVPAVLYGYSLGRAQRILRLFERDFKRTIKTTETICRYNELIAEATGRPFDCEQFDRDQVLTGEEALLVPNHLGRQQWLQTQIEDTGAVTAGFTGWALDRGYRYRRSVDAGFPLSDHCDFPELVALVKGVDPELVYLHHGFAAEFARELTHHGYDARALAKGQATLDAFS